MEFPYVVLRNLSAEQRTNFRVRFGCTDYDRSIRENIWRRHQDPLNYLSSGWQVGDARRRIIHYRDRYDVIDNNFVIADSYLYFNIKNTEESVAVYYSKFLKALEKWDRLQIASDGQDWYGIYKSEDLCVRLNLHDKSTFDDRNGWLFPSSYRELELFMWSDNFHITPELVHRPWHILKIGGIRVPPLKGNPKLVENICNFFPAQVEIGCGPSITAGIPPLNYQHEIYGLSKPDKSFIFEAIDDSIFSFIEYPEKIYDKIAYMQKCCLVGNENTPFYSNLKCLYDEEKIVGPIISNNFDGLLLSLGLPELSLRSFDKICTFPAIRFDKRAKSLFVVGSHADRRTCQQQARNHGLPIVFIDPEGYDTPNGFYPYPLEAPQDKDFLIKNNPDIVFSNI